MEAKETKEYVKKFLKIFFEIIEKIFWIILIIMALIFGVQRVSNNKCSFMGIRIYLVVTGSMVPKYNVGDVVVVREKKAEELNVGEDLTYNGKSGAVAGIVITHQIINIEEKEGERIIHTKGIANSMEDPEVYADQVIGTVLYKSEVLTFIIKILNNKYLFYFIGIVPLTILFFFGFIKAGNKKKK